MGKKTSKKTISLKKDSSSAKKGISITRLNQSESEPKTSTQTDLKGEIDFDAAEAKRKDAEKKGNDKWISENKDNYLDDFKAKFSEYSKKIQKFEWQNVLDDLFQKINI